MCTNHSRVAGATDFVYMSDVSVAQNACGPVADTLREWMGTTRSEEYEYKQRHNDNMRRVEEICKVSTPHHHSSPYLTSLHCPCVAQEKLGRVFPPPPSNSSPFRMCNLNLAGDDEDHDGDAQEDLSSAKARRKRKKTKKQSKIVQEGTEGSCRGIQSYMDEYLNSQGAFHLVGGTTEKYGDIMWDGNLRSFLKKHDPLLPKGGQATNSVVVHRS